MATTYAHEGDTLIIDRQEYKVERNATRDGGFELTPVRPTCDACHKPERGVDFEHEFGNLCGVCITAAMEMYAAHLAIEHLLNGDEEIVEVLHIMERVDAAAMHSPTQHVDFHSSTVDMMWGMSEDDRIQFGMSISSAIARVCEQRVMLPRP